MPGKADRRAAGVRAQAPHLISSTRMSARWMTWRPPNRPPAGIFIIPPSFRIAAAPGDPVGQGPPPPPGGPPPGPPPPTPTSRSPPLGPPPPPPPPHPATPPPP